MRRGIAVVALMIVFVSWMFASRGEAGDLRGVPLKPDPPFSIDGDLGDWASVPNALVIDKPEQVVCGKSAWTSPQDLSAVARVAWRAEYLFVAAEVVDDAIRQTQRGEGLWKGDHIELYLDLRPDSDAGRDAMGDGEFQIALSPGNFNHTGDALQDCPPEVFCYRPTGGSVKGILVASSRTATGWIVEAAIPWALLDVAQPVSGMALRFEFGVSDSDGAEPLQESLMTVSMAPWAHIRSRLMQAVLADADGVPKPAAQSISVFDDLNLEYGEKKSFSVNVDFIPADRDAVLELLARIQTDIVAGYTQALRVVVNGTPLAAERMLDKPLRVKARGGDIYSMAAGELFSTYYSPDFTSPDTHPHYGLLGGVKACALALRVTDLLKPGVNMIEIENAAPAIVTSPLIAAQARIAFRVPPPPPKEKAGPPTGALDRIEPGKPETAFSVQQQADAQLEITVGGETFQVVSQFSTPTPGWVQGSSPFFRHERRIEQRAEALVVYDTFTNLTNDKLPLMHRSHATLGARASKVWLAGLEQSALSGSASNPANPTSYAASGAHGLGFIALDDVYHVHVVNYAGAGDIGIADNSLVLRPNASYTAEWAIIPTEAGDYWRFINAARRLVGANFTIDGAFVFLRAGPLTDAWSDEQIADYLRFKDAKYVCASIDYPRYKGRYTHGTAFQQINHDNYRSAFARERRLVPGIECLVYFHCFIDVTDEGPEKFADARVLRPDGGHADYGEPYDRIYFPTETNSFGPEIAKNIDVIFDQIKAEGVYWDEHEYSRWTYHYGEPWDGCSGDIDPNRMTLTGTKSSVTLLTESWRLGLAKRILSRGPLVGNGPPFTRAMAALRFPCFVETGSITNCVQAHLYSPIALGDHLTERSELDAYRVMIAALDYGCVYHWYNDVTVVPTHPQLTRYMYPITPVELHAGYIIGRERILTKISGLFGWGDTSEHEVHAFDDTGKEAGDFKAPRVILDGKAFSEVRLPEDWAAAVMKK